MSQVMFEDAVSQLGQLIDQANRGEEVIITRGAVPVAQIVPPPAERKPKRPGYGAGKNDILYMADDFDAPLDDFKDYM